jgi:2-polyprenyl-3-methyl-5-hydroxy-6-metoxy-1,4-benzoquinol methylase
MVGRLRYYFDDVAECNMCGADSENHRVLGKRLNSSQGKRPKRKIGVSVTVMECKCCGLIFANPMPVPMDIMDHYGVPPEEYWRADYFQVSDDYFAHEIARLKAIKPIGEGMKSLDIGAGLGKAMIALSAVGFDAYGIEPSIQFHERAVTKMGVEPAKLKLGQIEDVIFPQENFDFITFGAVLEHLYNPSQSIEKALGWLKPGGIIHIEVPSSRWLVAKLVNKFYRIIRTDYVANISPMHEPYHLYEFTLKSFERHAKEHGYEIAFAENYVGETYLPKMFDFILRPYMRITKRGMLLAVWLKKTEKE